MFSPPAWSPNDHSYNIYHPLLKCVMLLDNI